MTEITRDLWESWANHPCTLAVHALYAERAAEIGRMMANGATLHATDFAATQASTASYSGQALTWEAAAAISYADVTGLTDPEPPTAIEALDD